MYENTLLNVFNSTIDRLDKKNDILKKGNSKIMKGLTDLRESVQYHSYNVDRRVEGISIEEITKYFFTQKQIKK